MRMRGADLLVKGLLAGGVTRIFSLSGNHIMPVYDALVGSGIAVIHTRHEAAAVHMADAWARLTGEVGVALVTGGQGHANAAAALCTAQQGEVPVLLLSGHAPLGQLGLGAFQELDQVAMAAPVTKASWAAQSAAGMAGDVARAFALARGGRPGPVHLSLPTDVLEAQVEGAPIPDAAAFARPVMKLGAGTATLVAQAIAGAARPLLIAPPALCTPSGFAAQAALEAASGLPVLAMQSPRGLGDPALGLLREVLGRADLIVLIGKALDFTLGFGRAPIPATTRFVVLEPEAPLLERAQKLLGDRLLLAAMVDPISAIAALTDAISQNPAQAAWAAEVREATGWRPAEWAALAGAPAGPIRSATLCAAVQAAITRHGATFCADGGEIGQWGMATIKAETRMLNGVAGAIGIGIPFAIGARAAKPAPTLALMGDGSFGFHMAELDTAFRHGLPFVAVVGNDSRWNAEHQIQLRDYGANRAHGCTLAPGTRYDRIASALGGHGEWVTEAAEIGPAIDRAFASGLPAVVNVEIDGQPAPTLKR